MQNTELSGKIAQVLLEAELKKGHLAHSTAKACEVLKKSGIKKEEAVSFLSETMTELVGHIWDNPNDYKGHGGH